MIDKYIGFVLDDEGGYVNDPLDRGGETFKGISRKNWPNWIGWEKVDEFKKHKGFPKNAEDDSNLTCLAREFYKIEFFDKIPSSIRDEGIRYMLVDMMINHGPHNAFRILQRAANVSDDGKIGPKTLEAVESLKIVDLAQERSNFFLGIVSRSPKQIRFLRGWMNRIFKILKRVID